MTLADRRYRSRKVPRFSPSGDDQIGNLSGGGVVATRLLLDWFDMVAIRLENMITPAGTLRMTTADVEPEGWLFLNGQSVDERLYPNLAAIFGATSGIVTLPDCANRSPMGAGSIVALNQTGGAATATLTAANNGPHTHGVNDPGHAHQATDPGHLHAAMDRGHGHGLQIDSHTHDVSEDADNKHTHPINDPGHDHENSARRSANQPLEIGSGGVTTLENNTATNTTGITVLESETDLMLVVDEAEVSGTVLKSQADIRVHKAKTGVSIEDGETGITLEESGEGEAFSIVHPVFGVNWMVKA